MSMILRARLRARRRASSRGSASPPLNPDAPVLLPGEVERKVRAERTGHGIPIDDTTHADLLAAAASVGIASERAEAMIA